MENEPLFSHRSIWASDLLSSGGRFLAAARAGARQKAFVSSKTLGAIPLNVVINVKEGINLNICFYYFNSEIIANPFSIFAGWSRPILF